MFGLDIPALLASVPIPCGVCMAKATGLGYTPGTDYDPAAVPRAVTLIGGTLSCLACSPVAARAAGLPVNVPADA